jgi:hypothetical protein
VNEVKAYEIGGKTYEQRPLVLGQWRQLVGLLADVEIPPGNILQGLITALEERGRLDKALAVVLTEQGKSPRDKDLDLAASELEFLITPQQIAGVIGDFFTCNPASSILNQLGGVFLKVIHCLQQGGLTTTGSSSSAFFSREETGANEKASSGSASPEAILTSGSNTESGS